MQEDAELTGIKLKGLQYKYRAFADDVLFIMEEPLDTIPKLITKINEFGEVAGFWINRKKSKLLCKNMTKNLRAELMGKVIKVRL